jgi:histone deacetylase complex regulatory component SIN3
MAATPTPAPVEGIVGATVHGLSDGGGGSHYHPPAALQLFDAREFVSEVKAAFSSDPEQFRQFSTLMRDFNRGGGTVAQLLPRLGALLETRPELIASLNRCLPHGYRIDPADPAAPVDGGGGLSAADSELLISGGHDRLADAPLPPTITLPRVGAAHELIQDLKGTLEPEACGSLQGPVHHHRSNSRSVLPARADCVLALRPPGARRYRGFLSAMRRMRCAEPEAAYDDVVALLAPYPEALARFEVRA